jgi:hypothetical protein
MSRVETGLTRASERHLAWVFRRSWVKIEEEIAEARGKLDAAAPSGRKHDALLTYWAGLQRARVIMQDCSYESEPQAARCE